MDHKDVTYQNKMLLTEGNAVIRLFPTQPVILYTQKGYHVLLELNKDRSIYTYLPNGEIIKIPPEAIEDQIVDINDHLKEDSTALDDSKVPEIYLQVFHLLTEEQKIFLIKQYNDLKLPTNKTVEKPTPPIRFVNFDIPTTTTIKCWYHPTYSWRQRKQSIYYCQGFQGTIYVQGENTSRTSHLIWEVQTYNTLQAKHYLDCKVIAQTEDFEKPTAQIVKRLVALHQIANNKPEYRCRLDLENKESYF